MSSPRRHLRDCTVRITGTSTTKYERRQWNLNDLLNSLDHGDQPSQHEQDVDDQRWTATAETPQFSAVLNTNQASEDSHKYVSTVESDGAEYGNI